MLGPDLLRNSGTTAWDRILDWPAPGDHLVHFYQADKRALMADASRFLCEGLKRGDGLLAIATPERSEALRDGLDAHGADPRAAVREGRLLFLDARETLEDCLVDGQPDWERFESSIGGAMQEVAGAPDHAGIRMYGEMVDLLWGDGQTAAAVRVEEFWNLLLASRGGKLYCAYPIDVFGKEFHVPVVDELLCAHTHLLPAAANEHLEAAVELAMDEVLGAKAGELRGLMRANHRPAWAAVPPAEALILWLRNNVPQEAEQILALARRHYEAARSSGQAVAPAV